MRILKLFGNDISSQLTELFELSFFIGAFPLIFSLPKLLPYSKKNLNLHVYSFSNIEKIFERAMYNHLFEFLEHINRMYDM